MKKLGLLTLFCLLSVAHTCFAQDDNILNSLTTTVPGQGRVTIHQDPRISALIGSVYTPADGEDSRTIKRPGYRIQVYAGGNTRVAKNEAFAVEEQIKEYFPDLPVYTSFNPPRWLCRAGDFRSIEEADAMMRQLKATGQFKEVSIVREQINIEL